MKHDEERIKTVANLYLKTLFIAMIIAIFGAYLIITTFFADSSFLVGVIVSYIFCVIAGKIGESIFKSYVRKKVYHDDINSFNADMNHVTSHINVEQKMPEEKQATQAPTAMELNILNKPEKPLAKYMDSDIYEWLDFEAEDGRAERFIYFGTLDLTKGGSIPVGCVLIQPGILYRHQSLERQLH